MLRLIFSLIRWSAFAVVVLVLAHLIEWKNRTLSDHIKVTLSHFETPRRVSRETLEKIERFSKEERARLDNLLSGQARKD
ncbi:MAG: hypothetical protein ACK5QT_10360 [Oligoflexia bacterium]